jgi:hypothetical protein
MAALLNLSKLRESCERMATADPDSAEEPLISMEDCYTIDGSRYEKTEKLEREKFGETRLEKINKYTLEYRERQKNLLIRRDLINSKFDEVIDDIIESSNTQKVAETASIRFEPQMAKKEVETEVRISPPKAITETLSRNVDVKNSRKIRELEREINNLKNKMDKNSVDFQTELTKYKDLGKNEEMIRKKLGIDSWNDFIEHVNDNNFEYKLGQILDLINENEIIEVSEDITGVIEDKTINDDDKTEARRAAAAADTESASNNITENFQSSINRNDLAQKLSVYENIGKISIERSPALAARANKIIDNSILLVGDFETLASDIIKSIRDRYYNSENGDYKELVHKTDIINENHTNNNLLNDTNKFADKNLMIQTDKYNRLKGTTKILGIIMFVVLVVSLVLVGQLL